MRTGSAGQGRQCDVQFQTRIFSSFINPCRYYAAAAAVVDLWWWFLFYDSSAHMWRI